MKTLPFILALTALCFGAQPVAAETGSSIALILDASGSMNDKLKDGAVKIDAVKKARDRILSGADIATPLRESGVISPAIAHMVTVGEKSGELTKMLQSISDNLESTSDIVIERLSAALEPLIIVVMAFFVGMIALAALLPILRFSAGNF